jgi:regulatory protein
LNTPTEILNKIFAYCAYQERCRKEIQQKLQNLGAFYDEIEDILTYLEEEGFLNEARFAKAFAGGKFRVKSWGRLKIRNELRKKGIADSLIEDALRAEISEDDYQEALLRLISKKQASGGSPPTMTEKKKIIRHLQQKGYEWEAIYAALEQSFPK